MTWLTAWPSAFLPVTVAVNVLPSAETDTLAVVVGLPSILVSDSNVRLSMRLYAASYSATDHP